MDEIRETTLNNWRDLKSRLITEDKKSWVLIQWYERLLNHGPSGNEDYEIARLKAFEKHYDQRNQVFDLASINAALIEIEDKYFPRISKPKNLPAQNSASIRAVWRGNIVTIDVTPVDIDVANDMALPGLLALKKQLDKFVETFKDRQSSNRNIDWSWIDDVAETSELITPDMPDRATLFELAIYEKKLSKYLRRLDQQSDEAVIDKLEALVETLSESLKQFPDIRNHRRSQLRIDLSDIPEGDREKNIARLLELFSSPIGQKVIDSDLTRSIENIGRHLFQHETDSDLNLDIHTDQIESVGNTFKALLGGVEKNGNAVKLIEAVENTYLDELPSAFDNAARELAQEDAKIVVKGIVRGKQAHAAVSHYGPKVIDKLPKSLNWFRHALKILKK